MKNRRPSTEDDIPLGHAVFLIHQGGAAAEIIPETMSFQVTGEIYQVEEMDGDTFDEEMFSALDHLRFLLKSRTEERHS